MWDSRRDQLGDGFLPSLLDIMTDVDAAFSLNDLYVLRTSREQKLIRFLEERDITDPGDFFDLENPHARPSTELPPIVAAFAPGHYGITWKATDLFLVHYVLPQLGEDANVPASVRALAETLIQFQEAHAATAPSTNSDAATASADDTDGD
jgi:hypothetical protein